MARGAGPRLMVALGLVAACSFFGTGTASALSTPTIMSTASGTTFVGFQVFDNVNLLSGANPTGSLTYDLFGPSDATCSGAPIFTSTVTVTAGTTSYNSAHFTTSQAGTYRWVVSYSGDANNNPVGPTSCTDPNEAVIVSKFFSSLSTTASPSVSVGGTIHDSAIVGGFNPTGTITFRLSGPTDTFCSAPPVFTATVAVGSGSGTYLSPNFTPLVAGTYRWQASYSGDANNLQTALGPCLDSTEAVTVTGMMSPAIVTTASAAVAVGGSVSDTATLSGGGAPTGTITFSLFGPNDLTCATAPAFTSMVPVTGNGSFPSSVFVPASVGTYQWTAAYSGDANNNPALSTCGAANESVTVTKANTAVVTTASAPIALGGTISDTATLSGGFSPTGTMTFDLFGPNDNVCGLTPAFVSTKTVSGDGNYTSASFVPVAAGTYRWVATYSGDANDNPAGPTACTDAAEAVVVSPPTTTTTSTTVATTTTSTSTTVPTTTTSTSTTVPTTTTTSTTTTTVPTTTTSTSTTVPATTTTSTTVPATTTTSTTVPATTTTSTSTTVPATTTTSTSTTVPATTTTSTSTTSTSTTTTSTTSTTVASTTTTTSSSSTSSTAVANGPSVQANPSTVAAGQRSVVSGHGFAGGSQLLVNLFSAPVLLATTTADSLGNYQVTVTIPAATTPGLHTVAVAPAGGSPQATTVITVTVAGATTTTTVPAALSFTGTDTRGLVLVGGALLLGGLILVQSSRRRHPELWPTRR